MSTLPYSMYSNPNTSELKNALGGININDNDAIVDALIIVCTKIENLERELEGLLEEN